MAVQLDATIVSVAIDTLGRDLHAGLSTIQWVSTAYLLALAMVIPLTGWSVDRFGSKRMWMLSLAFFLGGSVLCGAAWSAGSLIAFRIVQGIGGGLLLPLLQTILAQGGGTAATRAADRRDRGSRARRPGLGAGDRRADPRQLELALDLLDQRTRLRHSAGARVAVHARPRERGEHPLDVLGLALLSPGLAAIVYGFSEAGTRGGFGGGHAIIPLAGGAALLAAFAVHALRTASEPIIDLRLFRDRSFTASAGLMFLAGLSIFGAMLLLPLYYQQARDSSALGAGLLLAPQGLGMMIALPIVGTLTDRMGPRPIVLCGMALATIGTIPYTQVAPGTSELALGAALVIRGAGLGALFVPATTAAYRDLRKEAIPRATSAVRIFQQVGASFGTATLAVILQHQLAGQAAAGPAGLAAAFGHTFWWAIGFTALAVVPALLLPPRPTRAGAPKPMAPQGIQRPMRRRSPRGPDAQGEFGRDSGYGAADHNSGPVLVGPGVGIAPLQRERAGQTHHDHHGHEAHDHDQQGGQGGGVEAGVLGGLPDRDRQRVAAQRPQQRRGRQLLHHLHEHEQRGGCQTGTGAAQVDVAQQPARACAEAASGVVERGVEAGHASVHREDRQRLEAHHEAATRPSTEPVMRRPTSRPSSASAASFTRRSTQASGTNTATATTVPGTA